MNKQISEKDGKITDLSAENERLNITLEGIRSSFDLQGLVNILALNVISAADLIILLAIDKNESSFPLVYFQEVVTFIKKVENVDRLLKL